MTARCSQHETLVGTRIYCDNSCVRRERRKSLPAEDSRLHWLLGFIGMEIGRVGRDDLNRLQVRVHSFAFDTRAAWSAVVRTKARRVQAFDGVPTFDDKFVFGSGERIFNRGQLTTLQQRVRSALSMVRHCQDWGFRAPRRQWLEFRADGTTAKRYEGSPTEVFMARVGDVLTSGRDRIRWCAWAECGRAFVRVGKRTYCSPKCTAKSNWRAFTKRHPERRRDHHAEYERRRNVQAQRESGNPRARLRVRRNAPRG